MTPQHEVVMPTAPMAGKLIVGAFVVGLLASMHPAPRVMKMFGESQVDLARVAEQKIVLEAYPQWRREHAGCLQSVYELSQFVEGVRTLDPWGNRYETFCSNGRLVVVSTGEDGVTNTTDDIRSDR